MNPPKKLGRPFARASALNVARSLYDSVRSDARKTKSLPAFAALLGLKPRTYRAYERGERRIPRGRAIRIGSTLGIRQSSLLDANNHVQLGHPIDLHGQPLTAAGLEAWIFRPKSTDDNELRAAAVTFEKEAQVDANRKLVETAAEQISREVGVLLSEAGLARFEDVLLDMRRHLYAIADEHGFLEEFKEAVAREKSRLSPRKD